MYSKHIKRRLENKPQVFHEKTIDQIVTLLQLL